MEQGTRRAEFVGTDRVARPGTGVLRGGGAPLFARGPVVSGRQAARVTAVRTGTTGDIAVDWPTVTTVGTVTGSEKCVRGHIPGALNSDLGSTYGGFVVSARLGDNDPFWLSITF